MSCKAGERKAGMPDDVPAGWQGYKTGAASE